MASERNVPPPPLREPIMNRSGQLSPVWANWFTLFYQRAGSTDVSPTADIETLQTMDGDTAGARAAREVENLGLKSESDIPPALGKFSREVGDLSALSAIFGPDNAKTPPENAIMAEIMQPTPRQRYADERFIPGMANMVVNGSCLSSHRAAASLTTSYAYGPVDLLAVKAGGTVGAGTVNRATAAFSLTATGRACFVENVTLTDTGSLFFRHRIESLIALRAADKSAHFSARVYHDVGSTVNAVITISAADATDNFSSVTQIKQVTIPVPDDTNFTLDFSIPDMGDCTTGIEIEIELECGDVTTKDFYIGELQLSIGADRREFEIRPLQIEYDLVYRYLRPLTGLVAVGNTTTVMQAIVSHPGMRTAPAYSPTGAIDMTDGYLADYSQSSPHVGSTLDNTADGGRVEIGNFTLLTAGTFYIQRGTDDTLLASAEL